MCKLVCGHHRRLVANSSARPSSTCPKDQFSAVFVLQLLLASEQDCHTASSAHLQYWQPLQPGDTHVHMDCTQTARAQYELMRLLNVSFSPLSLPLLFFFAAVHLLQLSELYWDSTDSSELCTDSLCLRGTDTHSLQHNSFYGALGATQVVANAT